MNSTMRLLVMALLVSSGCRSTDMFSAFRSDDSSKQLAENSTTSPTAGNSDPKLTELSQAAASIPATTAEEVRQGQLLVASWYRESRPETLLKARQHFESALRQQPRNVDALHGIGIVADLQKQYSDAEKHYLLALAEQPSNSKVLGDLGYSYLLQKRLAESEQYLNRALVHDPNNQNAVKHLGDVYAQKGQTDLARATYRRVLNETEIEQALAANSSQATPDQRSLFDMMRNKPSPEEQLADDLRQRMEANREQNRQGSQVAQAGNTTPSQYPGRPLQGDALRAQLNQIDRERYANVSNGPIVLGGPGEPIQQIPQGDYQDSWANQGPATSLNGMTVDLASQPPPMSPAPQGAWNDSPPPNAGQNSWNSQGGQVPGQPPAATANGFGTMGTPSGPPLPPAQSNGGDLSRLTQPWGQPVAQAGAMGNGNGPVSGAQPVDPAYYQQPPPTGPGSPYMQPGPETVMNAPAALQTPAQGRPVQSTADPLQEASKAAARMGMGFGPGAMFPVMSSTATQSMPGSSTMLNGAANPPPQRYLPTETPPVDLRSQMSVQFPEQQVMTNQYGQQVPMGGAHMTAPHQLGTASRYVPGNVPSPYMESSPNLQQYDNQRNQAANELNSAIQQTSGHQMQSTPVNMQGVSHPGGSIIYSPQGGSQYTSPNAQPAPLPQYPYANRPAGTEAPARDNGAATSASDSQSARDIVVPESYRGRTQTGTGSSSSNQQPAAGPSQRISGWNSDLPQIVPGR